MLDRGSAIETIVLVDEGHRDGATIIAGPESALLRPGGRPGGVMDCSLFRP